MHLDVPFTFFISYRHPYLLPVALLLKGELERRFRHVRIITAEVPAPHAGEQAAASTAASIQAAHATILLVDYYWMPRNKQEIQAPYPDAGWLVGSSAGSRVVQEVVLSQETVFPYADSAAYGLTARKIIPVFVDCPPTFGQFALPKALEPLAKLTGEQIGYANWSASIGGLLDRLAARSNLRPPITAATAVSRGSLASRPLRADELAEILALRDYAGWYLDTYGDKQAEYLVKKFKFNDFEEASTFWVQASTHCQLLDHHPDWRNTHQFVSVALNTWDAGRRVTHLDLHLALVMNKIEAAILRKG